MFWPVSLVFRLMVGLRAALYAHGILNATRLPVPVVVVGNITAGGSGKTPLVIHLCQALREAGWRPGVVSRGYGGQHQGVRAVSESCLPHEVGDEPVLIARRTRCPVFVGRSRVRLAINT
ncbi:MAG: hypothetical protein RIR70_2249, partial [Pseudomonadota bacterium]